MLRAALLPRTQPAALNCLLVSKRWQKGPGSPSSTGSSSTVNNAKPLSAASTSNPTSTTKTSSTTTTARPTPAAYPTSKIVPASARTGLPPGSSRPSKKKSGGAIKAVIYGVAFGLTATLVYAEYENGSFRRQLETTVPYASDVLGGLDQFIDPIFGRQKGLAGKISENFPELAYVKKDDPVQKIGDQVKAAVETVKEKLPDKTQVKKAAEQTKETVQHALDKLPDKKQVKDTLTRASDQVKDAAKTVVTSVEHAKEKVEEKAQQVTETIKEALPHATGKSGSPASKINDPMFREEAGATALPPPIPEEKYQKFVSHRWISSSDRFDSAFLQTGR